MVGAMTSRQRVLAALRREPVDRTPSCNPTSVATVELMDSNFFFFFFLPYFVDYVLLHTHAIAINYFVKCAVAFCQSVTFFAKNQKLRYLYHKKSSDLQFFIKIFATF